MAVHWLDELNAAQREAVTHTEGPLLVIAGAGSGKTRVLTYRVAYLLEQRKALPSQILAVTFTNKAAREMKERLERIVGPFAAALWVGTFHATCVQILRRHADRLGYKRNFTIFDTADQLQAMREVFKELNVDAKSFEPRAVLGAISAAKNELIDSATYQERAGDYWERSVGRFYARYQEQLAANSAMDFDDLLFCTVRLFREHPDVLAEYQERFRYVLVDEYQDTNHAQYVLINLLCAGHRNLCVVGDADQSIYRFRGADIRNILDFERDYPDARVVKLEQNYRSTRRILEAANAVIQNNVDRPEKNLYTENEEGEPVLFYRADDERGEAAFVADEIERLRREEGRAYQAFTILYRTHAQSRTFEEEFIRRGMPYRIVSGVRFYERKEIKDLLAYLRLIASDDADLALRRVINVPRRGIGDTTLGRIERFAAACGISLMEAMRRVDEIEELSAAYARKVREFVDLIEELRAAAEGLSLTGLVDQVLHRTGYLKELEEERTVEAQARIENLKEFLSVAKDFETQFESSLTAFLDHVALISDADAYEEGQDMVTLMTLHAAKGLEFPVVFLVGMEEGVFPHSRAAFEPGELEEERRLCYVGMTRAMHRLYFTCARYRTLYGQTNYNEVSRFVGEVPPSLLRDLEAERAAARRSATSMSRPGAGPFGPAGSRIQQVLGSGAAAQGARARGAAPVFTAGERVRHAKFGVGTVVSAEPAGSDVILTVAFPGEGVKRLMAGMAPLERV